uniref:NADH dehydrogenase subunit 4L n=1 Tax=Allonothrus sinicus TaxID=3138099 RepID=UPI00315CCD5D
MFFYLFCFLFLVGFYLIFYFHSHYLIVLLGLEMVLLSVFFSVAVFFFGGLVSFGPFVFLLLLVCMGGFSVSLLVSVSRSFGKDFWRFGFLK